MTTFHYDKDFQTSVSLGVYSDIADDGFIGYNDNLQANVESTLSPLGLGILTTPSNNGELLQMRSTSTADVGNVIICRVLDADGFLVSTFSILNGTTPVPLLSTSTGTSIPIMRVNRVVNYSSPADDTIGDVLVEQQGGGTIFSGFKVRDQNSFNLLFTIPVDKKGMFLPAESTINKSSGSTASVILRTRVRTFGRGWWTVGRWGLQTAGTSAFLFETADKPSLDPLTDIMITAEASANAVDVSGRVAMQFNSSRIGA
jgi:hypothetical protein